MKTRPPKLGQHLLTSHAIAAAVVEAARVTANDTVLEVGPGKGMLTKEILKTGARVLAIEKDSEMVRVLQETFAKEITSKQLVLIEDDIRTFLTTNNYPLTTSYKVAANIPYYITGEIIRLLLTAPRQPSDIALLVQKEVAERIAKSKKESLLSLSVKAYGTPQYVRTVKAGSFNPPPSVDSAILAIHDISREHFKEVSEKTFFELLHLGFGQKRKTLLGNIKKWLVASGGSLAGNKTLEEIFEEAGIEKKVRAEDVSLHQWLSLTKLF
ncbi:MAG: 16S rRNA (adenine(1518)-N(6)/adenine(1519)-N(6))-dimethyltransferase RsmA [Patescibacteria group bacterium]